MIYRYRTGFFQLAMTSMPFLKASFLIFTFFNASSTVLLQEQIQSNPIQNTQAGKSIQKLKIAIAMSSTDRCAGYFETQK